MVGRTSRASVRPESLRAVKVSPVRPDEEWDAAALVVGGVAFAVAKVFAEPFAVVGGEDDDGVVGDAQLFERGEEATDVVVDFADLAVVAVVGATQLFVGIVLRPALLLYFRWEGGKGEGGGIVKVEVLLGGNPGGVGGVDAGDAEEGLAGAGLVAHELDGLFGDEGCVGHVVAAAGGERLDGEAFGRVFDAVLDFHGLLPDLCHGGLAEADVGELVGGKAADPGAVGIFVGAGLVGDFQVVEAVGRVMGTVIAVGVGLEMEFADVGGAVAVGCEEAGQGDGIFGHGHAHVGDAEGGGILPGEEAEAAGHAYGILHEAAVEVDALVCQSVEVGRVDVGIAVDAEAVPALLVGVDDEEVGTAHGAGLLRD